MFSIIGKVFDALIARPIFNLLIIIIALLPGHNLGVAIIIFTILVRFAMYPLLKKQLHHAMAMKKLQPEMRRIKKEAAGDKQKESQLMMELYKEREVNPFSSFGIILVQLPILIGLYSAISKLINDPNSILTYSYDWVLNLPYMQELAADVSQFDETLVGVVDLTRHAVEQGSIYWPAMILVIASVVVQFYQSKQLMMQDKNARSLRQIFKDTAAGKEVDQSEVQAATSKFTLYIIPFFLFIVAINLPAALSLYWFVGALVAIVQQRHILNQDVAEMEAVVDGKVTVAEVVPAVSNVKVDKKTGVKTYVKQETSPTPQKTNTNKKTAKKKAKSKKRR